MAITIKINGTDRSALIDWKSVKKTEVLTKEPDTLTFMFRKTDSKAFAPALNDTVEMFDGVSKIFGGLIVDISEEVDGLLKYWYITCKDYTVLLERYLVRDVYINETGNDIVADLIAHYTDAGDGVTGNHVDMPVTIEKIVFNYTNLAASLTKLCQMAGNYGWYIDADKDLHVFERSSISAPFSLSDTSQNYIWGSLDTGQNSHQIRNHIILRGGDTEGDSVTDEKIADGEQRTFFVGYSFDIDTLVVEKAFASSPTSFFTLTVGSDGIDNPLLFDCLYNPMQGLLIFPEASKPSVGDHIRWTGTPIFPLMTEKSDLVSISNYGRYEYLIVDKTIRSREAASQRIESELQKYANPEYLGSFATLTPGLKVGMQINIQSDIRNIDRDYIIQRIVTKLHTPDSLIYEVEILSQENVGMIDVLNKLVNTDKTDELDYSQIEVVDVLFSAFEFIDLNEVAAISTEHNLQEESISFIPADFLQPLDYGTVFVAGPWVPTISVGGADVKRIFCLDGSELA